jgi:hypothetical protein
MRSPLKEMRLGRDLAASLTSRTVPPEMKEHGDAALQRAEVEELAQEAPAALEGDVVPTGQPSDPLLDSADAKAMAAELATMSKAANTKKG